MSPTAPTQSNLHFWQGSWQPQLGKVRTRRQHRKGNLNMVLCCSWPITLESVQLRQRSSAGDGDEACWAAGTPGQLEGKSLLLCTTVHGSLKIACFLSTGNLRSSLPGQNLQPAHCPSAPHQQCHPPTELASGLVVARRVCCTETRLAKETERPLTEMMPVSATARLRCHKPLGRTDRLPSASRISLTWTLITDDDVLLRVDGLWHQPSRNEHGPRNCDDSDADES